MTISLGKSQLCAIVSLAALFAAMASWSQKAVFVLNASEAWPPI